jgi:hypothetical protein
MKKLLLLLTVIGSFTTSFAQMSCDMATPIFDNGTFFAPAVTGTYVTSCDQVNPDVPGTTYFGIWYVYTATATGTVEISSAGNVAPNSDDTRVSVWEGTCSALTCIGGSDDISASDYLTTYTFNAISGTTYYIQWDNRWSALAFDFTFTFTPVSCLPVTAINAPTNLNTTSITLNWDVATGTPSSYDVEYGLTGFMQGSGTIVNTTTNSLALTGLNPGGVYDYYVRSNCGGTSGTSSWSAVDTFALSVSCPYASGLDNAVQLAGWTINGAANLSATAANAQTAPNYVFINSSLTAATNASLNSRAIYLQANEQVTVTFYTRLGFIEGTPHVMKVWVNTDITTTGATQLGADINVNIDAYTLQTRTFTPTTSGNYYFKFNDVTPIVTTVTSLRFDSFNFTSVLLGTNDFLASNLSIYPNPTKNIINISNTLNAVVDNVILTDLNGRVVKSQKINATEGQVNISDLATGIYMMNVTTNQGSVTKKIVKE